MPRSPALLVLDGLRDDVADLVAVVSGPYGAAGRWALLGAAAAELAELAAAHARRGEQTALAGLSRDAAARAAAQLRELASAADALGDAAAVIGSAGLSGSGRTDAVGVLAARLTALAGALPSAAERGSSWWDDAAVQCDAPDWLLLGSALRRVRPADVPPVWSATWEQVRANRDRSALHRVLGERAVTSG